MSCFFLKGYWKQNLGDDLFVKTICDRYPEHNFYLETTKENKYVFNNINNLKIIETKTDFWSKVMRKIKHPRLGDSAYFRIYKDVPNYVELGGSIFILTSNEKNNQKVLRQRNKMVELSKNYFVIGSNFGPYTTEVQHTNYLNFFSSITGTVFRDENSLKLFKEIENIKLAPDVVLSNKISIEKNKDKHIVISLIDLKNRKNFSEQDRIDYENKIIEFCMYFLKHKKKIVLMGFCKYEGDLDVVRRINSKIPNGFAQKVVKYIHSDIDESLRIIQNAEIVIATRFHAMILAWLYKKPTLVISYSSKTIDTINYLFPEQQYITISNIAQLNVSEATQSLQSIPSKIRDRIIEGSNNQFYFIDKVLSDNI